MTEEIFQYNSVEKSEVKTWYKAARVEDFPVNGGACVLYDGLQIAVFNFARKGEWYATQNLCPHKKQMVLSRGMVGTEHGEPKVACPFHKKKFSLKTGKNLDETTCDLAVYPVKVEDGYVFVGFKD